MRTMSCLRACHGQANAWLPDSWLKLAMSVRAIGMPAVCKRWEGPRLCPRDAQRDFDKQAEKQKGDLDGDSVILCHTDKVLREGLPHLRGLSVLDARLAEA